MYTASFEANRYICAILSTARLTDHKSILGASNTLLISIRPSDCVSTEAWPRIMWYRHRPPHGSKWYTYHPPARRPLPKKNTAHTPDGCAYTWMDQSYKGWAERGYTDLQIRRLVCLQTSSALPSLTTSRSPHPNPPTATTSTIANSNDFENHCLGPLGEICLSF